MSETKVGQALKCDGRCYSQQFETIANGLK